MGMPVRIEDELYEQAKLASRGECRTIEYDSATRILLLVGSHENFYRNLKRA